MKTIPDVVHLNESDFRQAMLRLRKLGGENQRAYNEACIIINSLRYGEEELNKLTNHGESRIRGCIKYDISNKAHRLVTVRSDNCIYLLFVGTHEEVDRWLDQNKGLTISVNEKTKKVTPTHVTRDQRRSFPPLNYEKLTEANSPYFESLEFDPSEFIPQKSLSRAIRKVNSATSEEEIEEIIGEVNDIDKKFASMALDVIFEMREGRLEGAKARIEQFREEAVPVQDDPLLEEKALRSEVNSDRTVLLGNLTEEQIKDLFSPEKFQEWMIFLHHDQRRIAEGEYDRPVVLTGVSGSGKTCVLVHRARYLARKYPGKFIGVLTLNRSLSRLIENLINELCDENERRNIRVMAFYDYFKKLIEHFGPDDYLQQLSELVEGHEHQAEIRSTIASVDRARFARDFDERSGETLDDTRSLFANEAHVRTGITYFSEYLRQFQDSIEPEEYLFEEFSLIRSALATKNRGKEYLELERQGRAIKFPEKIRALTHNLLLLYEETMLHGGMLDELSLTSALLPSRTKLKDLPDEMRFHCLLIDEFQDFSTLDLALLRLIPTSIENGLFVAGDSVQRVLVKSLKLASVGLDITQARWEKIAKNYRNSRQILQAASHLANLYGKRAKALGEDIEILDPELAARETGKPVALKVPKDQEIQRAWQLARDCIQVNAAVPWSICIATASPKSFGVNTILACKPSDFPVSVNRLTGDYTRTKDTMTVGTTSDVKGFEFSMIIIVGCGAAVLPPRGACREEEWREALRLYVAMTRGRDQVSLLYSGSPSEFLTVMKDDLSWQGD